MLEAEATTVFYLFIYLFIFYYFYFFPVYFTSKNEIKLRQWAGNQYFRNDYILVWGAFRSSRHFDRPAFSTTKTIAH